MVQGTKREKRGMRQKEGLSQKRPFHADRCVKVTTRNRKEGGGRGEKARRDLDKNKRVPFMEQERPVVPAVIA